MFRLDPVSLLESQKIQMEMTSQRWRKLAMSMCAHLQVGLFDRLDKIFIHKPNSSGKILRLSYDPTGLFSAQKSWLQGSNYAFLYISFFEFFIPQISYRRDKPTWAILFSFSSFSSFSSFLFFSIVVCLRSGMYYQALSSSNFYRIVVQNRMGPR